MSAEAQFILAMIILVMLIIAILFTPGSKKRRHRQNGSE